MPRSKIVSRVPLLAALALAIASACAAEPPPPDGPTVEATERARTEGGDRPPGRPPANQPEMEERRLDCVNLDRGCAECAGSGLSAPACCTALTASGKPASCWACYGTGLTGDPCWQLF